MRPSGRCYARRSFRRPRGVGAAQVERQRELTADDLWNGVADRLKEALNDTTYRTWFDQVEGGEVSGEAVVLTVPNDFTRDWIEAHFLGLVQAAVREFTGDERPIRLMVRPERETAEGEAPAQPTGTPVVAPPVRTTYEGLNAEVHVRLVRDRVVQPLRPRGGAGGGGGAGPGVQPALHLRRHRARQDASAPGRRPVRRGALQRADRPLRDERDLHERLHQLAPRQAHRGLQTALPQLRPADDRRHPVPRGQGADPGGVLPHVQLALRGRPPDRDLVRPAAEGDRDAGGAAALALRVGAAHGHPAAGPGDAHRDPAQARQDRPHPRARPTGPDLHRRPRLDEHPRARGGTHACGRLLLAHRPADDRRPCPGRAPRRLPARGARARSRSSGSRKP